MISCSACELGRDGWALGPFMTSVPLVIGILLGGSGLGQSIICLVLLRLEGLFALLFWHCSLLSLNALPAPNLASVKSHFLQPPLYFKTQMEYR